MPGPGHPVPGPQLPAQSPASGLAPDPGSGSPLPDNNGT